MRKFTLLGLAIAATLALPASAYDGTIDFEGEVSSNTCVINGGAVAPLKVVLPKVQVNQLAGAVQSTAAHTRFTIGLTAFVFGLQYRIYYSAWHGPVFSWIWANQFVFTVGGAVYQFIVIGMPFYYPLGFLAVFLASLWFARHPR